MIIAHMGTPLTSAHSGMSATPSPLPSPPSPPPPPYQQQALFHLGKTLWWVLRLSLTLPPSLGGGGGPQGHWTGAAP